MKRRILDECLRIAARNNHPDKHPQFYNYMHYTFVVQGNKVLDWGTNMAGNPRFGYKAYMKIHSEFTGYQKSKHLLKKNDSFEIVNVRLGRMGTLKISKPCSCCVGFLRTKGCKRVYFTTADGFASMVF